ncbi:MAG: Hsp20/alpha crystallin family protein [Nocardioidaceae bacterium]
MATVAKRTSTPMADMLEWLETNSPFSLRGMGLAPYVRVEDYVEGDMFVLRAELPGIDPDKDVELQIEHDMLTISGERHEEIKDKNHREFHYGSFRRTVPVPPGTKAEDVKASYSDGVLEVRVPTTTEEPAATRIPVQRAK